MIAWLHLVFTAHFFSQRPFISIMFHYKSTESVFQKEFSECGRKDHKCLWVMPSSSQVDTESAFPGH